MKKPVFNLKNFYFANSYCVLIFFFTFIFTIFCFIGCFCSGAFQISYYYLMNSSQLIFALGFSFILPMFIFFDLPALINWFILLLAYIDYRRKLRKFYYVLVDDLYCVKFHYCLSDILSSTKSKRRK